MASESSANAGSNLLRGNAFSALFAEWSDPRSDDRDEGRSGVVGRDVHEREFGLALPGCDSECVSGAMLRNTLRVLFEEWLMPIESSDSTRAQLPKPNLQGCALGRSTFILS